MYEDKDTVILGGGGIPTTFEIRNYGENPAESDYHINDWLNIGPIGGKKRNKKKCKAQRKARKVNRRA